MNNYLTKLEWRYAVKKFDPSKKLTPEQLDLLIESLRLTPSSSGMQLWKFYVVENMELRDKIREAASNQSQITDASHLILLASRKSPTQSDVEAQLEQTAATQHVTLESLSGYRKSMEELLSRMGPDAREQWAARQIYIALGFLLSAAAENSIDTCPMEGFNSDIVTQLIGADKEGYVVRLLVPAGFRSPDDPAAKRAKVRFDKSKVVKKL
jgi:nitroreductase